jgi:hypothetical protein
MSNELEEKATLPIIQIPRALFDYIEKNLHKPKDIKKILASRKSNFEKEYLKLNEVQVSSTCEVKINSKYKYGHLTLYKSKMTITEFESTKIRYDLNDNSMTSFNFNNDDLTSRADIFYPIFFIDFNLVTCDLIIHKTKQKFRLIILGRNLEEKDYDNDNDYISKYRVVKFKMPSNSSQVFRFVCEEINKSIILSKGYSNNLFSINIRKNFCIEYFMGHKQFARSGKTGDILLFRGYAGESKFQRMITNVEYDHVAILVKQDNILHVYESTGKDGVKLRPWQEFLTYLWYLLYEKMVFRPLIVTEKRMELYINEYKESLNDESSSTILNNEKSIKEQFYKILNKKVNDFIKKSEDKKYSFSKLGFLCKSHMRKNTIRKGYSCSELVSACYYHSGLITDELDASNYLPGNFSRLGNVKFKEGIVLGEEYIIDFASTS